VSGSQQRVPVSFDYAGGTIRALSHPRNAPIEGARARAVTGTSGGGRGLDLYELFDAHPVSGGAFWTAGSGAVFDLASNVLRHTAGPPTRRLPIFPVWCATTKS
jgi:hypothetical protein